MMCVVVTPNGAHGLVQRSVVASTVPSADVYRSLLAGCDPPGPLDETVESFSSKTNLILGCSRS